MFDKTVTRSHLQNLKEINLEYSYFTLHGGQVSNLACEHCNSDKFNIKGKVKYAFVFLEFVPFFPTNKKVILSCVKCHNILNNSSIDSGLFKSIKKSIFKFYFILPMYTGVFLTVFALAYWQYIKYQENLITQEYIQSPQKNDFYFINYHKINKDTRPNQNYRLGKVVSVNNGLISIIYGGFTYTKSSSLIRDVQGGMTYDSRYFNAIESSFTIKQLQDLYKDDAILAVKRPKNNRLYGNVVIDSISINKSYNSLAEMYNDKGLAFMSYSHIESNLDNAYKYFLKSSENGFSKGQVNLSKLYLGAGKTGKALYWLDKAAIQGNFVAIKLYIENCKNVNGCEKARFINKLKEIGFNISSYE